MKIPGKVTFAAFRERLNRFVALVELEGQEVPVHLPNSGRMSELLVAGRPVLLVEQPAQHRKTRYDMILTGWGGGWIGVDARMPPQLVEEALREGRIELLHGYDMVRRETTFGESRIDLLLSDGVRHCLLETKSVNLVCGDRALFPDAPTLRGARHLRTLMAARAEGYRAAVLFVVQREDANRFSPYEKADPLFAQTLREAAQAGVEVYAYRCRVDPQEMTLTAPVPVCL